MENHKAGPMNRGRGWATAGFLLGIGVSVGGNVAHTWHPSMAVLAHAGETADSWRPALGAQVFAAVWPLALLVTVEVLARVDWPRTFGWAAAKWGGASMVAGVAAVMSYAHLNGLLRAYGEDDVTARIGPLSIDGLMIVCGFALLAIGRPTTVVEVDQASAGVVETPARDRSLTWWPLPEIGPVPTNGRPVVDGATALVADGTANGADPDHDSNQVVDGDHAGQGAGFDLDSAIRSARDAGLSERQIAEKYETSRHRVRKVMEQPARAGGNQ